MSYFAKATGALLIAVCLVSGPVAAGAMRNTEKVAIAAFLKSLDTESTSKGVLILASRTDFHEAIPREVGPETSKWMPKATRQVVEDFLLVGQDRASLDTQPALVVPGDRWKLVNSANLDRMFDQGRGWTKLHAEYPGATLMRITRAGIDEKSQQALFMISSSSGPVSGIAYYVLLHRIDGKWQVLAIEQAWIS
jgi:hypothetical protein